MLRFTDLAALGDDFTTWLWLLSAGPHTWVRRRSARRRLRLQLQLEALEDRTLLSASIFGNVFNDVAGTGVPVASDPGVASQVAYLDFNGDGTLDSTTNTVTNSSPRLINLGGVFVSPIHVSGLSAQVQDVAVNMNLSNSSGDTVPVVLLSPTGLSAVLGTGDIFNGPYLFNLRAGQSFANLTIDGNTTPTVNGVGTLVDGGTYGPLESFSTAQTFVDTVNPNGVWGLLFLPPSGSAAGITLNAWSLRFTQPEPSVQTDAAGNFSFTGVAPGTYTVRVNVPPGDVVTSPGGATQTVTVVDGQTLTGVDFGIQPAADLRGVSFTLAAPATAWGQNVTINYTVTNQGAGNASAFTADVRLSADGTISGSGPLLTTLHLGPLTAGASESGSVTVALPATAPAGFDSVSTAYVGMILDPLHAVTDTDTTNNRNEGAGIDLAQLGPQLNQAVSSGSGVQQDPSIAVDPTNPNHLVTAYMDYSLLNSGYAGIGLAVSNDGGKTWTNSSVPLPAGFSQGAAEPTVAFDANGNVFVSFMAATFLGAQPGLTDPGSTGQRALGLQSNNGIFVASSSDGGRTWGTPVAVDANVYTGTGTSAPTADPNAVPFDAYPKLAVDTAPGSPYFGQLYVTWSRFYPGAAAAPQNQYPGGDPTSNTGGSDVMFAVSTDSGASWTTQAPGGISAIRDPFDGPNGGTAPAGNGFVKFSSVTIGADGAVYVATDTGGFFTVYTSRNGGQTFKPPLIGGLGGNYRGNPFDYTQTGVLPDPTLDNFATFRTRAIAADPTRPGVLYAVAPSGLGEALAQPNNLAAANGIVFAVSTDYGMSWTSNFTVGSEASVLAQLTPDQINSGYEPVLNDENAGLFPGFAASLQTQVVAGQAFPSIAVSPTGVITVVWYDTRSDASGTNLEVWGTVSTDGGQHFSANFPVSNTPFNPNDGAFTDATGKTNFSLGTQIGIVATAGSAYAVWTDTRNGGQQVYGGSFALNPVPAAPVDRFAPDFTRQTAATLGTITAQQIVPRLNLLPGQADEWFALQAGATGELSVSVAATGPGSTPQVELTDANGNVLPATVSPVSDASGNLVGEALVASSVSGQTYYVHVFGTSSAGISYTLTAATLTANFGTQVQGTAKDTVAAGTANVYRLAAGVTGTLQVTLTGGASVQGSLNLTILGADGQTALATDPAAGISAGQSEQLTITLTAGQVVFLQVSGANLTAGTADFTLRFANFDQFETPNAATLFFPTAGTPNSLAAADLSGNGTLDLIASSTTSADTVSVLAGNGDGTFQPGKQFDVGPGQSSGLLAGERPVVVAKLNADGNPDVVVPNFKAGDVSVLLGNGDGTLQPQRLFDAVPNPTEMVAGDFNGDGNTDLVVRQSFTNNGPARIAVLLGRGDGTFLPPVFYTTAFSGAGADGPMVVGDFGNGHLDIVLFNNNQSTAQIFLGNGDGTFADGGTFATGEGIIAAAALDLNGDGHLDLVATGANTGNVYVLLGNGNGTFQAPIAYQAMAPRPGDNVIINGVTLTDFGSSAGTTPDGIPDIIVTAAPRSGGPAEVIMLPGNGDGTFGAPVVLANVGVAGSIVAGDFGNGTTDLAVADTGGITVIYGTPVIVQPNTTPGAARNLGNVAHLVTQPQAIVTGHADAYYRYTAPTEVVAGAGDQVVDISASFSATSGGGLSLEVLDQNGQPLPPSQILQTYADATGVRLRVELAQGETVLIHVFGVASGATPGAGVYTLSVDTLPQVVSIQAEAPLPGGPTTSIVITLQGDRLDPTTADNAANYTVTWAGPDGIPGTADDVVFHPATTNGTAAVLYSDSVSLGVNSGLTYLTQTRQTITLLFDQPLPTGTYTVTLAPAIQAAAASGSETAQLVGGAAFAGHPVVSVSTANGALLLGSQVTATDLVGASGTPMNLNTLAAGTPFLTEYHDDAGTLLESLVAKLGDDPSITAQLNQAIQAFFGSGVAGTNVPVAIFWFDPVSIDLADSQGARTVYDLNTNTTSNSNSRAYMQTGGSIEVMVLAGVTGALSLNIGDVQATARGGAVIFDGGQAQSMALTDAIRGGARDFEFDLNSETGPAAVAEAEASTGGGLSALTSITVPLLTLTATLLQAGQAVTVGAPQERGEDSTAAGEGDLAALELVAEPADRNAAPPVGPRGHLDQAVDGWAEAVSAALPGANPLLPVLLRTVVRPTSDGRLQLLQRGNILPATGQDATGTPVRPAAPASPDEEAQEPEARQSAPVAPVPIVPAVELPAAVIENVREIQAPLPVIVQATEPPRVRLSAVLGLAVMTLGIYQGLYQESAGPHERDRRRPRL